MSDMKVRQGVRLIFRDAVHPDVDSILFSSCSVPTGPLPYRVVSTPTFYHCLGSPETIPPIFLDCFGGVQR